MLTIQDQNPAVQLVRDIPDASRSDLPPAYDTLSLHHNSNQCSSAPTFLSPAARPPNPDLAIFGRPVSQVDRSLPPPPLHDAPSPWRNASYVSTQRPQPRKNTSWLSLLPFVSSISAKRVRKSVLTVVGDLVVHPSRTNGGGQQNVHEILASVAETCAEHKVSLSSILQETFIADHTPMYWAIVNYRQELLVALLVHSQPLSIQTISDIRRACLVGSNQALFHALRVCRRPFHQTEGIRVPSLRTASDNLLLGNRPMDEIHIRQTSDQTFVVSFGIPLWQRRMKAIGQVSIEFIACGRMWSITFFSTGPSPPAATSRKPRKDANTWHVVISLLESSPPTFFDSQLVVDALPPLVPEMVQTKRLREVQSTPFLSSGDKQYHSDYRHDRKANSRSPRSYKIPRPSEEDGYSSSYLPPPAHPLRGSASTSNTLAPITIRLGCGNRKLARRAGTEETVETPTVKPDTWLDHGVGYTNAVVSPLVEGPACQLLSDHSRYLLPDGTLSGRLEARLVRTELSKDCIIC